MAESQDDGKMIVNDVSERTTFTSEVFKIEMQGIPKFFSVSQAKKMLLNLGLQPHKIKPCGQGAR